MSMTVNSSYVSYQVASLLQQADDPTPASQRAGGTDYSRKLRDPAAGMTRSSSLLSQISEASDSLKAANDAASDMQSLSESLSSADQSLQAMKKAAETLADPDAGLTEAETEALVDEYNQARDALLETVEKSEVAGTFALEEGASVSYDFGTFGGGQVSLETGLDLGGLAELGPAADPAAAVEAIDAAAGEVSQKQDDVETFARKEIGRASDDLEMVLHRLEGSAGMAEQRAEQVSASAAQVSMDIAANMNIALLAQGNFGMGSYVNLLM
jgi:flagellin-like hook-associated protein FlgL